MSSYTIKEIVAELKRELAMRRRVFPDWVRSGRLKQVDSDQRIALMQAAIERLEAADIFGQQDLFGLKGL